MSSAEVYRFSATLCGHSADVRSVYAIHDTLLSGSRDGTAIKWNRSENEFRMTRKYEGHTSFVSVVTVSPPTNNFPEGLIYTGSNDKNILAFLPDESQPLLKLEGHTHNVCALTCDEQGGLLSGSWDSTARYWVDGKSTLCLKGHEAAVWAVLIMPGAPGSGPKFITGSADKSIRIWSVKDGRQIHSIAHAHTDCVRGLVLLASSHQFLSCSNDASIRRWDAEGVQLAEYYAHSNYIYSVAVLPNEREFVSCGEDRTLRVWNTRSTECVQTLTLPAQSIWSCTVMGNGDVAVGCSDATLRVFSRHEALQANATLQEAFREEVASSQIPSQLGDIETDKLPGTEALHQSGNKEGQVLMIREGGSVACYQWSTAGHEWVKVGDVVGAQGQGRKQMLDGKEYDYVFDVDLNESGPAMKIGCNRGDDPWHVAQAFIHQHDLSQLFLDQIAKFLISQTGSDLLGGSSAGVSTGGFADPFTGGSRYAPGQEASLSTSTSQPYHEVPPSPSSTGSAPHNPYFPKRTFVHFKEINLPGLSKKLRESAMTVQSGKAVKRVEDLISAVEKGHPSGALLEEMFCLMQMWPQSDLVPLLDMVRWALQFPVCASVFLSSPQLVERLLAVGQRTSPQNYQMLVVRALSNCFNEGVELAWRHISHWLDVIRHQHVHGSASPNVHIAVASLLLNVAVKLHLVHVSKAHRIASASMESAGEEHKVADQLLDVGTVLLEAPQLDPEAAFRAAVACGTALFEQERLLARATASSTLRSALAECAQRSESLKLMEVAVLLIGVL